MRSRGESYRHQTVGGRCGVEHDISDGLAGRLPATGPRALTASTVETPPHRAAEAGTRLLTLAPTFSSFWKSAYTGYSIF